MSSPDSARAVRKLAAIVVADVVGYSRQMAQDEEGTLDRLRSLRAQILDPAMREHGGRLIKLMGDGLLAEFASAVSATAWAVAVQHAIAARNEAAPGEQAMQIRIGVNVGDVILEEDDIYGDGVNVAARLEPLAPRGGVCISSAVYDHVAGKVAAEFVARGERALKNIARPVSIFCWSPLAMDEDDPASRGPSDVRDAGRKPSLAVRAFDSAGSSGDATFLAAAVHEATVSALSNLTGLTMQTDVGRADYSASATIQAVGQRYRATVRLVDTRSGQQFWSDRFDGDLAELFDAQDDLAFRISTALRFSIYDREVAETEAVPAAERTTEQVFARLGQIVAGGHGDEWPEVGPALDAILVKDPNNSGAHAMKGHWYLHDAYHGWRPVSAPDAAAAVAEARLAIRCNERSDFAHMTMSVVHLYGEGDTGRAVRESERALELNPYYAIARYSHALALTFGGDPLRGREIVLSAAQATQRNVINHRMLQCAALACWLLERHDEAIDLARRADHRMHGIAPTLQILAAAAASAGRADEAGAAAARLLQMFPDFRLREMRRWPFRDASDNDRFVGALRDAGLPE